MSLFWRDALDEMIGVQLGAVDRSHLTITFTDALPARAAREIARLPGVLQVEAYRSVPVELRAGTHSYRTALTGLPSAPILHRVVDSEVRVSGRAMTDYCSRAAWRNGWRWRRATLCPWPCSKAGGHGSICW